LTCAERKTGRQYIQVGVQAWDLCKPDFPETYSSVAHHMDFIKKHTKEVQVQGETNTVVGSWEIDGDNRYHVNKGTGEE